MKRLLVCLLLGCGGAGAKQVETPTRSPAVVELAGKADAVCACDDGECAADRFGELLERQAVLMTPAEQVGLDAEHDRAVACFADKSGRPRAGAFVAYFGEMVERICACSEAACVKTELEAFPAEAAKHENAVFTAAEQRQMEVLSGRASECFRRFPGPAEPSPAVSAAERMADAICACPDTDCAVEAAAAGKAELEQHREAMGDEVDGERILAAGKRASDCIEALRGR